MTHRCDNLTEPLFRSEPTPTPTNLIVLDAPELRDVEPADLAVAVLRRAVG